MPQNATILIADISGYTKFLTKTELEDSSEIINDLLKVIVEQNTVGLTLLEIEGDAVLFYKKGKAIRPEKMITQCVQIFESFHQEVSRIDEVNTCNCCACTTVSELSIKFIVHYGPVKEIKIAGFTKVHGIDMIVAHRLLKNNIASKEYILFSDNYIKNTSTLKQTTCAEKKLCWLRSKIKYPVIGRVAFQYAELGSLRNNDSLVSTPG